MLSDADYSPITEGLAEEWRERWVQFNVPDVKSSYAFGKRLKDAIINGSTERSAMYENYDRIERMNTISAGLEYRGDVDSDLKVDYSTGESSQFNQYWRYIP